MTDDKIQALIAGYVSEPSLRDELVAFAHQNSLEVPIDFYEKGRRFSGLICRVKFLDVNSILPQTFARLAADESLIFVFSKLFPLLKELQRVRKVNTSLKILLLEYILRLESSKTSSLLQVHRICVHEICCYYQDCDSESARSFRETCQVTSSEVFSLSSVVFLKGAFFSGHSAIVSENSADTLDWFPANFSSLNKVNGSKDKFSILYMSEPKTVSFIDREAAAILSYMNGVNNACEARSALEEKTGLALDTQDLFNLIGPFVTLGMISHQYR